MRPGAKANATWIRTACMSVGEALRSNAEASLHVMFTANLVTERTERYATERFGSHRHARERAGAGAEMAVGGDKEVVMATVLRAIRLREAGGPAKRMGIRKFQDFSDSENGIGPLGAIAAGLSGAHMFRANKQNNVGLWKREERISSTLASHVFTTLNVFPEFVVNI